MCNIKKKNNATGSNLQYVPSKPIIEISSKSFTSTSDITYYDLSIMQDVRTATKQLISK